MLWLSPVKHFRNLLACLLTIFCGVVIVTGLILDCNVSTLGGVTTEPILLLACFYVLFVNEGYQVGLLGVRALSEKELVAYPRAVQVRTLIFGQGDKLPRLFLGQSFLVVVCTFLISQLTTFLTFPSVENVPEWLMDITVRSGLPGVIFTVNMIQLLPSILAQEFPAQFLHHTPGVYSIVRVALFIESIGIVQATYLIVEFCEWVYFSQQSAAASGVELLPSTSSHLPDSNNYYSNNSNSNSSPPPAGRLFHEQSSTYAHSSNDISHSHSSADNSSSGGSSVGRGEASGGTRYAGDPVDAEEEEEEEGGGGGGEHAIDMEEDREDREGGGGGGGIASLGLEADSLATWRLKALFSAVLTLGCAGFIVYSILGNYSILRAVPGPLLLLLLLTAYALVFYCEGLKIAIVGSAHLTTHAQLQAKQYPTHIHDILTTNTITTTTTTTTTTAASADGVPRFLLGRQLIVVPVNFLVATITQFSQYSSSSSGWMTPTVYFLLVGLGLPGMLVTMQVAQLAPQVLASSHTGAFLRLPAAALVVYLALGIECIGLTQCAFLVKGLIQHSCCSSSSSSLSSSSPSSPRSEADATFNPIYSNNSRSSSTRRGRTNNWGSESFVESTHSLHRGGIADAMTSASKPATSKFNRTDGMHGGGGGGGGGAYSELEMAEFSDDPILEHEHTRAEQRREADEKVRELQELKKKLFAPAH